MYDRIYCRPGRNLVKLFEFVDASQQEATVFDSSASGQRVAAERTDEPGAERPKPGDGSPGEPIAGRKSETLRLIAGDTQGDWAWKPGRNRLLNENMVTFLGVARGMPEQLGRTREAAGEPGAIRYGNPGLPICKHPRLIPSVTGSGFFDTRAGSSVSAQAATEIERRRRAEFEMVEGTENMGSLELLNFFESNA